MKDYENDKKCTESSCDYYNCMMELNCSYSEDNSKCVKTADPLSSHAVLGAVLALETKDFHTEEDWIRKAHVLNILGKYFS